MSLKSPAVEGGSLTLAPPAKPSRTEQHKMGKKKVIKTSEAGMQMGY